MANIVAAGVAGNAVTTVTYAKPGMGDIDLTECFRALEELGQRVNTGDCHDGERLLMAQSISLNTMYGELARLANLNIQNLAVAERLFRLAFKAQNQSRATMETLATIKAGPAVFARQANIAHGAQQVNNGTPLARAGNSESEPNKLLAGYGERLDAETTSTTSAGDQELATMGVLNRSAKR